MAKRVLGIVGSYRKGGIIDSLVTEVLDAAAAHGAEVSKVYLLDKHIEFCTNCRTCTQTEGPERGQCVQNDDMGEILAAIDGADVLVLGAPVNFFNINALTRRFMERLVCYAYWPWGKPAGPKMRTTKQTKQAVLITSTAMPAFLGKFFTGAPRALRLIAKTVGAKPAYAILVGMIAVSKGAPPPEKALAKARRIGHKIAE